MSITKDQISTQFMHRSLWETIYKTTEERLTGDPYIGVSNQALETAEPSA